MPDKVLTTIKPRKYQQDIFEKCKDTNCLVVLPTGIGKTLIALMLSIYTQKKHPGTKTLFLAPTRPLAEQHLVYFKKHLPELFAQMELFTGKINAETRKKIWEKADIIFSTPQCVDGETLIFTEEGPIKISEFFKNFKFEEKDYKDGKGKVAEIKEKILGYDGQKISFLEASKAWKLQGEGLIKIKTEIGNTLLCTKDHPLLTIIPNGEIIWKQASLLNKGDYIASIKKIDVEEKYLNISELISCNGSLKIADKFLVKRLIEKLKKEKIKSSKYSRYRHNFMPIKLFSELSKKVDFNYDSLILTDNFGRSSPINLPKQLDFKLAYILGAMLGDGHLGNRISHGGEVVFSDLDRESVCNEFENNMKEVFGVDMKKEKSKGLIAYNSALSSVLNCLGIPKGSKAKIIQVPKFLFFADIESIRGFIKGIFDTDGSASKYHVSISSVSEKFIQELKWLFLKIGILGSIEKRKSGGVINNRKIKASEIFTFRFSGRQNLQKFLETSPDKDKCKKLIETLRVTKKPETRSKEILPIPELMRKIHKSNMGKAKYYLFRCLSIDNLKKLSKNLEGEDALKLKRLLNLPIRWVKIKEKQEYNEEKEVYDLTIENHHNFIANCIINHNCIGNDLKNELYDLSEVSLLVEDEAHRCLKNYSYTYVAQKYKEQAKNPQILGLTASPGTDKETIKKIANNLGIETIELRTRESEDVKEYLQELKFDVIPLEFPKEFREITEIIKKLYEKKVDELKNRKLLFRPANKISLLEVQGRIMKAIYSGNKNFNYLSGASACAQAIKLSHLSELLQTQTLHTALEYIKSIFQQSAQNKSKAAKNIANNPEFNQAYVKVNELLTRGIEHPKLLELKYIVEDLIKENPKAKIIVFSQYRETGTRICKELNLIPNINARVFVGQAKKTNDKGVVSGLNQKEQHEVIEKFKQGEINLIISTSIGEEGLDIPEVNAVIFYEPIPSAIRKIQRAGRTARLMKGRLIILLTKDTLDEIFYWASRAKEKRMYTAIEGIKRDLDNGISLNDEKLKPESLTKEKQGEQKKLF